MKRTNTDILMFIMLGIVGICLCTYFIGMMLNNQPTNENNKELRLAIIAILSQMTAAVTTIIALRSNKKDDN